MNRAESPGLYIHIPFCHTKCPYCDFYSIPSSPSLVSAYLDAVQKEMILTKDLFPDFDTLYIGGGTPSILSGQDLARLMGALRRHFAFAPHSEITIEANPDDITPRWLAQVTDLGVTRISLGVQSLREAELRFLQRRHTAAQTLRALETIRTWDKLHLGMDLMYGFQGHSREYWKQTLSRALEFDPDHLSCYQMTIEKGTVFGRLKAQGLMQTPGDEEQRRSFLFTSRFLAQEGYVHYEVSNFAKGLRNASRHNQKYWRHISYLGLGPAAHSYHQGRRWWNLKSVTGYCRALAQGNRPVEASETLSPEDFKLESLFLGFRTLGGIRAEDLESPGRYEKVLSQLEQSGLIKRSNGCITPTPEGFLVADGLPLLFLD
jgi:oxygen-independent coproporphyrinogen-3 oxidase